MGGRQERERKSCELPLPAPPQGPHFIQRSNPCIALTKTRKAFQQISLATSSSQNLKLRSLHRVAICAHLGRLAS